MPSSRTAASATLITVAVIVFALNLRVGVAAVSPVLSSVRDFFSISDSTAGIVTAIPGFMFALMGFCAVPLARRGGLTFVLVCAALLLTVGTVVRPLSPSFAVFLLGTVLLVAGIAVGNVLLPAWIKSHSQGARAVLLMTCYTTLLGVSGAIGSLSALFFDGENAWRGALGVWVVPAIAMLVVWGVVLLRMGARQAEPAPAAQAPRAKASMWSSPTAIAMMVFFAFQSASAYVQMGWLSHIMMDLGVSAALASISLAVVGMVNILGGLVMPTIIARMPNLAPVPVILAVFIVAGWLGIYFDAQAAPLLWATLLGVGGMSFPLALALLTARTRAAKVTAQLSGFVQPSGYLVAGLVPLAIGFAFTALGSWTLILWALTAMAVLQGVVGIVAARNVYIDDELAA